MQLSWVQSVRGSEAGKSQFPETGRGAPVLTGEAQGNVRVQGSLLHVQ